MAATTFVFGLDQSRAVFPFIDDLPDSVARDGGMIHKRDQQCLSIAADLFDAARAITRDDATGRELADSLYADLYGTNTREGQRVSKLAIATARMMGIGGPALQRLRYASLLHDLGVVDGSVVPTADEGESISMPATSVLRDIDFLQDVLPLLELYEDPESRPDAPELDCCLAYIVAALMAHWRKRGQRRRP